MFADGTTAVVGYPLAWDSDRGPQYNYEWLKRMVIQIWAECNGIEYGPVTLTFNG